MVEKAKKTVVIFGAKGLLGQALGRSLKTGYKVIPLNHQDCDITLAQKVEEILLGYQPWAIINAAAYTDVDGCQKNSRLAYAVNSRGILNIAQAAKKTDSLVIHISTDYIFSGRKKTPYKEDDPARPINVYGKSKLQGEKYLRRMNKRHLIIRTSWLFGKGKSGFIDRIIKQARNSNAIAVVDNKYSTPTYAPDLAGAVLNILNRIKDYRWQDKFYGTYHITNSGRCSWYEYARVILKSAKIPKVKIKPLRLSEIRFIAQRPRFSVLDNSKYITLTHSRLRPWQEAVKEHIQCTCN